MDNLNRNTRTLIVSFLIAVFALIPLRFIEAGQQQEEMMPTQVLGEKTEETIDEPLENKSGLEAPYSELEKCFSQKEIKAMENEVEVLVTEIGNKKNNICQ